MLCDVDMTSLAVTGVAATLIYHEKKMQILTNQYCGHILGCLLINDAVIAKGFVLWTGFVQTLPIG